MCIKGKQFLIKIGAIFTIVGILSVSSASAEPGAVPETAGGVIIGDNLGGFIDRVWVAAPPNTPYILELQPGSFLDCGTGQLSRTVDSSGRDEAILQCGVTLTEIIHLPDIGKPAMLTIHY